MTEPCHRVRWANGNILDISNTKYESSRAGENRNPTLKTPALASVAHVSFSEEKHESHNSKKSLLQPGHAELGRHLHPSTQCRLTSLPHAPSPSARTRSSSLTCTLSKSAKRFLSPFHRLMTMSTCSREGCSGASSATTSLRTPLLTSRDSNNKNGIGSPAVPAPHARVSTNIYLQHDRISAHFDGTMARVLQLPFFDSDEERKRNELVIDSGTEDELSLAVKLALPGQLQLLGAFLGMYAEFDGRLGDKVAGIRHMGMVGLLDGAISTLRGHVSYFAWSRQRREQVNARPNSMEATASAIIRQYDGGRAHLEAILMEGVDMSDATTREAWVTRKDQVLGQLMGGLTTELNEMEKNRICTDEVRKVKGAWVDSWDRYAAMHSGDLRAAGCMDRNAV